MGLISTRRARPAWHDFLIVAAVLVAVAHPAWAQTGAGSIDEQTKAAQLEKLKLESRKLAYEVTELSARESWYISTSHVAAVIAPFIGLLGLAVGIYQYAAQQKKNREAAKAQSLREREAKESQSLREKETSEREFMKPWLSSQREVYLAALSAASEIANSRDPVVRAKAEDVFWQLYHGQMILVETTTVSGAMVEFGEYLENADPRDPEEMNERCRALATVMAESMAATAKMTFEEFARNQFKYTAGDDAAMATG